MRLGTRLRGALAVALIAAGSLGAPAAQAVDDNSTADHPAAFTGSASGAIPGGGGGHFAFYKFSYPGDQRKVTINLNAQPNDFEILQYVGNKVYGPTGHEYLSVGSVKDATPNATGDLATTEPGEYTIQVYNYAPNTDVVVTFQLAASNLPPQPTPAARPAV